jgi:hypothetical protein
MMWNEEISQKPGSRRHDQAGPQEAQSLSAEPTNRLRADDHCGDAEYDAFHRVRQIGDLAHFFGCVQR